MKYDDIPLTRHDLETVSDTVETVYERIERNLNELVKFPGLLTDALEIMEGEAEAARLRELRDRLMNALQGLGSAAVNMDILSGELKDRLDREFPLT